LDFPDLGDTVTDVTHVAAVPTEDSARRRSGSAVSELAPVALSVGPSLNGAATLNGSATIVQAAHTGTVVTDDPLWCGGLVGAARP
jgi:hypothetical protein